MSTTHDNDTMDYMTFGEYKKRLEEAYNKGYEAAKSEAGQVYGIEEVHAEWEKDPRMSSLLEYLKERYKFTKKK